MTFIPVPSWVIAAFIVLTVFNAIRHILATYHKSTKRVHSPSLAQLEQWTKTQAVNEYRTVKAWDKKQVVRLLTSVIIVITAIGLVTGLLELEKGLLLLAFTPSLANYIL